MDTISHSVNTNANATHVSLKSGLAPSVSDFEERTQKSTLVDKTPIIETFINEQYPIHLVLRPRRCGKTTLLTMFQSFFEIADTKTVEERRRLYKDTPLVISKSPMFETYFAQHPVIYINFADVKGDTFEEMKQNYKIIVRDEIDRQEALGHLNNLDAKMEASLKRSLEGSGADEIHAFSVLAKILKYVTKKKVIVLIDEYDTPILSASQWNYVDKAVSFFSQVYSKLLKNNMHDVHGAILAGIIRIEQTGFLSGLNNLQTFSLDSSCTAPLEKAYSTAFLFTREEVETIYKHYHAQRNYSFTMRELEHWYGGYCTADGRELFNPWSICRALESCSLQPYWTGSGIDNILLRHIATSRDDFQGTLGILLEGRGVVRPSHICRVGIADDMSKDELLNVLHYTGYLTRKDALLCIPNQSPVKFKVLFKKLILKFMPSVIGHHCESNYQLFLFSAFRQACSDNFMVTSESQGGHGRMDLIIEEVDGTRSIILELKVSHVKGTRKSDFKLPALAREALQQIEDRCYRARLRDEVIDLREYGIAFFQKHCEIRERLLKRSPGGDWVVKRMS
ncbi:hypothetical protein EW145_g1746 [Phellinidium pouzarii]|uniref:AAA-ATPase-like domain-containing protein n=1 Tax=Phellinidium pouzarii TaxID=167371 RepID=A0A4S4LDD7_9AGAM|nr:hypothetical protein EW145_g1746 [Phellinidium pouzarii]